jgi:putative ABC transport system substrate-binding protein
MAALGTGMKRRELIRLLVGGTLGWPLAARAQPAGRLARIGFLGAASAAGYASRVEAFRSGLRELGYVEGANIMIEYRWAEENNQRLPELAAELVRSGVDVIVCHGTPGSLAAKHATATIPIVMANVGDPVGTGVVSSLARPGGNVTGLSFFAPELGGKRIALLKDLKPQISRVAYLVNPANPSVVGPTLELMETTAKALQIELQPFPVRAPGELATAFERMAQANVEAVAISDDAVFISNAPAVAALMTERRLLSIGSNEMARSGGLVGYGVDSLAMFRRAAGFVDRILKGIKVADIPVEQATKFELVLNLKTAKALGLNVPPTLLALADEVIE